MTLLSRALLLRSIASRNACTLLSLRPAAGVLRGPAARWAVVRPELARLPVLELRFDVLDPRVDVPRADVLRADVRDPRVDVLRADVLDPRVDLLAAGLGALEGLRPVELAARPFELPPRPVDLDPPDLVAIRFLLASNC